MKAFPFLIILCAAAVWAESWDNVKTYRAPASVTNGMAWDGKYLWNCENYGPGAIYRVDPDNGREIGRRNISVPNPGDIAYLNNSIWVVDEGRKGNTYDLYQISPSTGQTLKIIQVVIPADINYPSNQVEFEGLTTDGKNLYVSAAGTFIFKVNPETGEVLKSLVLSWANGEYYVDGLAFAWGHLFGTVNTPASIVEIDPNTGAKLMDFRAPSGKGWGPEGLTFDGTNLWYTENTNNLMQRIRLNDGYYR